MDLNKNRATKAANLLIEARKTGPIDKFRSITKDIIFKGSFFIAEPFVYIKKKRMKD